MASRYLLFTSLVLLCGTRVGFAARGVKKASKTTPSQSRLPQLDLSFLDPAQVPFMSDAQLLLAATMAAQKAAAGGSLVKGGNARGGGQPSKNDLMAAVRAWVRSVKDRMASRGNRKGKGKGNESRTRKSSYVADPDLGLPPPRPDVLSSQPNFNPTSRYLTAGIAVNSDTGKATWSFAKDVDASESFTGVDDQGGCASCWALATSAAIQSAYSLLSERLLPLGTPLSAQQLVDCLGTGSCRGGYPEDALSYASRTPLELAGNYPYVAANGRCSRNKTAPSAPIKLYEQVPLPGPLGLMLALQYQPVIVTLRASTEDFINYQSGIYYGYNCYDPDSPNRGNSTHPVPPPFLDHVVLAVGYHYEAAGSYLNYFLIRNSWGADWGEGGYMKISMGNLPHGTCGMLVQRGLYPVLPATALSDPCAQSVCGGGECLSLSGGGYSCTCTVTLALAANKDGTQTCVPVNQCSLFPTNPCGAGACINSGDGGYSCLCPANFQQSQLASGQKTCVPVPSDQSSTQKYVVQGGETCYSVHSFFGLTFEQFKLQNPTVDCESALSIGSKLNVALAATTAQICRTRYPVSQADASVGNCDALQEKFGIDVTTINPGLDCSQLTPGQQICLELGDSSAGTSDYQLCREYLRLWEGLTCDKLIEWNWNSLSWLTLFRLNPGLYCDNINTLLGQELCVAGEPLGAVQCGSSRSATVPNKKYTVRSGDNCGSLLVTQFQRNTTLVASLNRGWVCRPSNLYVGMSLCIPTSKS